jgi:hypothetical protein
MLWPRGSKPESVQTARHFILVRSARICIHVTGAHARVSSRLVGCGKRCGTSRMADAQSLRDRQIARRAARGAGGFPSHARKFRRALQTIAAVRRYMFARVGMSSIHFGLNAPTWRFGDVHSGNGPPRSCGPNCSAGRALSIPSHSQPFVQGTRIDARTASR